MALVAHPSRAVDAVNVVLVVVAALVVYGACWFAAGARFAARGAVREAVRIELHANERVRRERDRAWGVASARRPGMF